MKKNIAKDEASMQMTISLNKFFLSTLHVENRQSIGMIIDKLCEYVRTVKKKNMFCKEHVLT